MNKEATNISPIIKALLAGSAVGIGAPVSIYGVNKLRELNERAKQIEDSLHKLKTRTLPLSVGASVLGSVVGSGVTNKALGRSNRLDQSETGMHPDYANLFSKYNSYKEEFIQELIKESKLSPDLIKILAGAAAAIPTTYIGTKYGGDWINSLTKDTEKEMTRGQSMLNLANVLTPVAAAALGYGAGVGTTHLMDKFDSYKDFYKDLILRNTHE